ncbi:MAG TPA: YHYH protein [Flavobacterium sp.]|uniref:YHYH protein n=1 Tax=Flavobacterium sp. TaxID=239 RepID=UPI002CE746A7|nr:YHYH protein [Flavobacterium sp.]HNP31739.1 YHYH protein [Flavobacterium sp.]
MRSTFLLLFVLMTSYGNSQTNPIITQWLRNTTGITGRHYVSGNSTPITDAVAANVQTVQYSTNWVYVTTNCIPAYITGPFLDGNPSLATSQNGAIFKFPLNPTQNTGTPTATTGGNIGLFKNGVALFDYRDGVSWKNSTQTLCGGPIQPACTGDGVWNRDAVLAEKGGFDCSKAHPAMGNYHHHQNPSAFNLDLVVISTVCSTYPSDGLYVINPAEHSPLIGFAYDGFPIYGAYGYANTDGTGGIVRMKSSYQLRNITTRTVYANGTDVTDGPAVSTTYPLGYFREDYEYIAHPSDPSYLDEHNGRFCVTPEYPSGIYCYFATVDANHNSAYPYVVGPTFYGNKTAVKVTTISESTTQYTLANADYNLSKLNIKIYPNPAQDFIAIQSDMIEDNLDVSLIDELGKVIRTNKILQGSTLAIIDLTNVTNGVYFIKIAGKKDDKTFKIIVNK